MSVQSIMNRSSRYSIRTHARLFHDRTLVIAALFSRTILQHEVDCVDLVEVIEPFCVKIVTYEGTYFTKRALIRCRCGLHARVVKVRKRTANIIPNLIAGPQPKHPTTNIRIRTKNKETMSPANLLIIELTVAHPTHPKHQPSISFVQSSRLVSGIPQLQTSASAQRTKKPCHQQTY